MFHTKMKLNQRINFMAYIDKDTRKKLQEWILARQIDACKKPLTEEVDQASLTEEILKTAAADKTFLIGDKVRILAGEKQGKIGSINYCNGGKCVVKLNDEQLFMNSADLDYAAEKPLDEMIINEHEDDIEVAVDGEVIADTSTDAVESGEVSIEAGDVSVEEYGPKLGLIDLLLAAVTDENEAIQKYNELLAACNDYGFEEIANVIRHINEEENIHVGMLQYAMSTISDQAKTIQDGVKEAEDIIASQKAEDVTSAE